MALAQGLGGLLGIGELRRQLAARRLEVQILVLLTCPLTIEPSG